jgi:hypothetical protein
MIAGAAVANITKIDELVKINGGLSFEGLSSASKATRGLR